MTLTRRVATLAVLGMLAIGACSDDDGQSQPPAGRGSATCHTWQSAYCSFVTKCQGPAAACEQAKAIVCASDAQAQSCASALSSATCTSAPANCDLRDVADPAPAQKSCEDLRLALCQRSEECQPGSRDTCIEQVKTAIDCTKVIGIMLAYESCLPEIAKLSCATMATLPPVCMGVLLF